MSAVTTRRRTNGAARSSSHFRLLSEQWGYQYICMSFVLNPHNAPRFVFPDPDHDGADFLRFVSRYGTNFFR